MLLHCRDLPHGGSQSEWSWKEVRGKKPWDEREKMENSEFTSKKGQIQPDGYKHGNVLFTKQFYKKILFFSLLWSQSYRGKLLLAVWNDKNTIILFPFSIWIFSTLQRCQLKNELSICKCIPTQKWMHGH